ncbi:MAG: radical SAM family heme chaperone HemW [Candidatus Omnitrophica bacterium]|nr:radical SAM family heme chaperone HemW [Candidatus Omnitrophota bacterium]
MPGLYVHIPFCSKKCHYCNFVVTLASSQSAHEDFFQVLEREVAARAGSFAGRVFETLYIGGGTPSLVDAGGMKKLFDLLHAHFQFKSDAEVTLEANPGDVTVEKATAWRGMGINRVSLGAQTFNDATLARLNRSHDAYAIGESFGILRNAGFGNLSLDLILSLPGEGMADVEHSLRSAVALGPEHVSLYELTIEEKTKFWRDVQEGKLDLPGEDLQLEMLSFARSFLKRSGFGHYELLSYAKPGLESRHNQIYWANGEYLGLGPGAFSYENGRRTQLAASVDEYFRKIKNQDWEPVESEILSPEKKARETVLLALRLTEGADVGTVPRRAIQKLKENGLVEETPEKIRLTAKGQLFAETVFAELSI